MAPPSPVFQQHQNAFSRGLTLQLSGPSAHPSTEDNPRRGTPKGISLPRWCWTNHLLLWRKPRPGMAFYTQRCKTGCSDLGHNNKRKKQGGGKKKTHLWVVGKQHLANAAMSLDRKLYVCRSGKNILKRAFSSSLQPRSHVTSGELRKPYSPSEVRGYLSYSVPMLVWGCCWLVLTPFSVHISLTLFNWLQ